jgi:hypothetical protein
MNAKHIMVTALITVVAYAIVSRIPSVYDIFFNASV